MKSAVSCWAAENLRSDVRYRDRFVAQEVLSANTLLPKQGFAILFGITFGQHEADQKRHAYNWYLNWDDLTKIVFFDPITNDESGT
jgi:hypothetical protein